MIKERKTRLWVGPFLFLRENPTIIGAALTQRFLHNEAKWKVQINEDIGVIKIKSCRSYAFLNNEHCGYWRGRKRLFSLLIWHTSQISFNQNLSSAKYNPCPFCSTVLFVLYLCSSRSKGGEKEVFFYQKCLF